jgi:predicted RNase H-like nuclease (RuvC/YqgF family)
MRSSIGVRRVIRLSELRNCKEGCSIFSRINELESINRTLSGKLAQVQQENQALKSEIEELREKDRENLNRLFR